VDLSLILLHHPMHDRDGKTVATSLTLNDTQDLARSACTFGIHTFYVAHPSAMQRKLGRRLKIHWQEGFGATYNPSRKEALTLVELVHDIDEAILKIELRTGKRPKLIATSAKAGALRVGFEALRQDLQTSDHPHIIMLGTGSGMAPELLERAQIILEPIYGPGEYNHLSVRAACAIILDRLCARRS
jgi:hypothetical protein